MSYQSTVMSLWYELVTLPQWPLWVFLHVTWVFDLSCLISHTDSAR